MAAPGGISALLLAEAEYLPSYWLLLAASPSAPKGVHKLKLHDLQTYMIGFAVAIFYRVCLALVLAQQQAKMSEKNVLSFEHTRYTSISYIYKISTFCISFN